VIGVEGQVTGDGRIIEPNALRWEVPIPLRYVQADQGAHDGAEVVGQIDSISRGPGGQILGAGTFDTGGPTGIEAMRQVSEGLTTGISMDLDDHSFEVRVPAEMLNGEGMALPPPGADGRITVAEGSAADELLVTTSARIRAATIVALPAFSEAVIHMAAMVPGMSPSGSPCSCDPTAPDYDEACVCGDGAPMPGGMSLATAPPLVPGEAPAMPGQMPCSCNPTDPNFSPACTMDDGDEDVIEVEVSVPVESDDVTTLPDGTPCSTDPNAPDYDPACVEDEDEVEVHVEVPLAAVTAGAAPMEPPAAWFSAPKLSGPTPLTVTEQGQIYGHLAQWGTCHISHTHNGCVTPPHSSAGYAYFRTGSIVTAEGSEIPVGHVTLDTRHAGERLSASAAAAHYEDTGSVVADVAAGEDQFGIWVAGAVRPGVSAAQVRALRAAPLSGDWRRIGSSLELVAALSVNVPGFPVPRPKGLVAGGVVRSLVASGMVAPKKPETLSDDDLRYLRRLVERERREEATLLASGTLSAAEVLARRVRATTLSLRAHRPLEG
jgi:hypothetical protein